MGNLHILACNGKTPDRVASRAMRPHRTITSRCLQQSCGLTDAQTGFFSVGRDGEPAGRAGSSGATGAQGNPGSHFTHADSRTHTHTYIEAHSLHLLCTVPQHNMLVLVYSFLAVYCNGCSARSSTRGINLFISHAVVSLCAFRWHSHGRIHQTGLDLFVPLARHLEECVCRANESWLDKSRSLSEFPMSCLSAGEKKERWSGWQIYGDWKDECGAVMNRSVRGAIKFLSVLEHGLLADCGVHPRWKPSLPKVTLLTRHVLLLHTEIVFWMQELSISDGHKFF